MVGSVFPSTPCHNWALSRHLQKQLACPWPVISLDFVPFTWKVTLIRCIFIPLLPLVEAPYTEDLGAGGVFRVTKPDGGLLGGFRGAEDPPGL